jgi:hypothetical protein
MFVFLVVFLGICELGGFVVSGLLCICYLFFWWVFWMMKGGFSSKLFNILIELCDYEENISCGDF